MIDRQPVGEDADVGLEAAARAGQWEVGWTKHGTPCMTRAVRLLNRPAVTAEGFERRGGAASGVGDPESGIGLR